MQTYELIVSERSVRGNSNDMTLVRTSIGIDQIHVLFDNAEWMDFPITVSFGQGDDLITQSLVVSAVDDSEWVAEATCLIPHEVTDMVGPIRVTFQGTDSSGRHIITAKGSPLYVEEAGDVTIGTVPSSAPSVDQWNQAYAQAMTAVNEVQSILENLNGRIDSIVAAFNAQLSEYVLPVATNSTLGGIKVGDRLSMENGVLSADVQENGMTVAQERRLSEVHDLAEAAFDSPFADPKVKASVLPTATGSSPGMVYPDGTSIVVDDDGMLHGAIATVATTTSLGLVKPDGSTVTIDYDGTLHGAQTYVLPKATTSSLGGVKVDGTTVTVDNDGTIHGAQTYTLPAATTSALGGVKPDGTSITVDNDGTIHGAQTYVLPAATTSALGGVKPDGTSVTVDQDGTIHVPDGPHWEFVDDGDDQRLAIVIPEE